MVPRALTISYFTHIQILLNPNKSSSDEFFSKTKKTSPPVGSESHSGATKDIVTRDQKTEWIR